MIYRIALSHPVGRSIHFNRTLDISMLPLPTLPPTPLQFLPGSLYYCCSWGDTHASEQDSCVPVIPALPSTGVWSATDESRIPALLISMIYVIWQDCVCTCTAERALGYTSINLIDLFFGWAPISRPICNLHTGMYIWELWDIPPNTLLDS